MTSSLGLSSISGATPTSAPRRGRFAFRALAATATVGALLGLATTPAFAAPLDTSTGSTVANVEVGSTIALTGLTPTFTLEGDAGATETAAAAVTMNVKTNALAGYTVTVQAAAAQLVPTTTSVPANPDTIPIGALSVRETGATTFTPLSNTAAVPVGGSATRSAENGDDISNDYQVVIPFVNEDTYAVTLNYVATAL